MQIEISAGVLASAINAVRGAVGNTTPLTKVLYIEAQPNKLRFVASSGYMMMQCSVEAAVSEDGITAVEPYVLSDYIKTLSADARLTLTNTDSHLEVKCGRSKHKFPRLVDFEMPVLPSVEGAVVSIPSSTLKYSMKIAHDLASRSSDEKACLRCLWFDMDAESMNVVATDQKSVYMDTIQVAGAPSRCLMSHEFAREVINALPDAANEVTVELSERTMAFTIPGELNLNIVCWLVSAEILNYHMLMTIDKPLATYTVNPKNLMSALLRLMITAKDDFDRVTFELTEDSCLIHAQNQTGEAQEVVPCVASATVGPHYFSAQMLINALRHVASDEITVQLLDTPRFPDEIRRLLFTSTGETTPCFMIIAAKAE